MPAFHVDLSIQYCCSVRLYVWEMSYFLVSFMVDAVVNGPYVQYVIVLLLDYMCEKCQTWWQFLLSFIVDAIVNDLCVQELLKVVYTEPSHTFLCDVNYNPGKCTSPPCLYLSLCLSLSLCLCLCVSHTYRCMFTCTCKEEVVGLCDQGTGLEIKRLLV